MNTNSATTDMLAPGQPLVIRGEVNAADGSADRAKTPPPTRAANRQSLVLYLFPSFICAQVLLIAALLLLNYLNSIG
jgi:hypothetical protein